MIRSRHAFTLIELLAAMGIAVLLAGVVFAIYAGALRTLDSQGRWRAAAYPAAAALDALALDLSGAAIPWGITNPPFELAPAPDGAGGFNLHLFTAAPVSAGAFGSAPTQEQFTARPDFRGYALREIFYDGRSVPGSAGANGAASRRPCGLIRAWSAFRIDIAGDIASGTDVWENVCILRMEAFDGTRWTNQWGGGTNTALPQAVRGVLAVGNQSDSLRSFEVLIPAGRKIAAPKLRK